MINHFRALFPRWDFFDRIAYKFCLEVQSAPNGDWQRLEFLKSRKPWNLLYNPGINLALAHISLIDQFVLHRENSVEKETSLQMLAAMVRQKTKPTDRFKFKVVAFKGDDRKELFVSDWLKAESE